jgi:penicillin-binding protein 2
VLDATNGEVLAMVTHPSFDPSLFNSGVSQAQWDRWMHDPMTPLINKAVAGIYPPGSTFKVAVALAALSAGALSATDRIFCPGHLDIGNARFYCWLHSGHGSLDLHGGLKNSCDVFFYNTALRVGIDRISAMAHRLGLGVELPIELSGVRPGIVPTREWRIAQGHPWNVGDTVVCGIGQGYVAVTPLELATYVARVATGRAVEPHLTRSLGGAAQPGEAPAGYPPLGIPEDFLRDVRAGMWAVVNDPGGTAPKARLSIPGVQMAGKTGSAEVTDVPRAMRESGHYNSMNLPWKYRPHALFICFAPYDAPRYAVSVVVEHGNAGADVAGPIARLIMTDTLLRDPARRVPPQTVAAVTRRA